MNKKKFLLCDLGIAAFGLALDQITKLLVRQNLETGKGVSLIDGWLEFYHHENTGASWGMLKGQTLFFIFIALIVSIAVSFLLLRVPAQKKYLPIHIAGSLIFAGALGNTVDRIAKGSVTDFISFVIIHFPIFNVADILIVCATFWMAIMIIFVYKDADLEFLDLGRSKKTRKKQDTENGDKE
ncbi:MAG: signal peptidase II [Lachnospiraceae bacterium]|nr:signal peptidase II [Lachnospiraceae bacterium]